MSIRSFRYVVLALAFVAALQWNGWAGAQSNLPDDDSVVHAVGVIQSLRDGTLVLKTDKNITVTVLLQKDASILRIAPKQINLDNAHPFELKNIQVGDRVLVHGTAGDHPNVIMAFRAIVIKEADLAEKQQQERDEWQKHGVGGLVRSADLVNKTIVLSGPLGHTTTVQTSTETRFLRYAGNSEYFSDAREGTFDQIRSGDQVRVLGTINIDTNTVVAKQIVSGSFRNIAGVILVIDGACEVLTVRDLISKRDIMVNLSETTQLRRLPDYVASGLASLAVAATGSKSATGDDKQSAPPAHGVPELARILGHAPVISCTGLHKGDALMIVGTVAEDSSKTNAITILSGVEPILSASPPVLGPPRFCQVGIFRRRPSNKRRVPVGSAASDDDWIPGERTRSLLNSNGFCSQSSGVMTSDNRHGDPQYSIPEEPLVGGLAIPCTPGDVILFPFIPKSRRGTGEPGHGYWNRLRSFGRSHSRGSHYTQTSRKNAQNRQVRCFWELFFPRVAARRVYGDHGSYRLCSIYIGIQPEP